MERRKFLKGAGLAGVLASGTAPAIVHAQENIRWRLASSFPKSTDTLIGAAEVFAKTVSELTGGKFQVTVHAAGELVPAFGVVDAIQQGTIECANTAPYYFFGKDEAFAFDCAIPFGMNERQLNAWMFEGNGMKLLREFYAPYNIISFPMGNTGAQMGGWFRKEIKSVADFNGLKFRVGGFGGRVLAKLGVVSQNIPAGEIYSALEKGALDATEFVGPHDDLKLGLYRVAPYYYYPAWWEGSAQTTLYVSAKAFNGLSKEYQAAVRAAAAESHVITQARYDARNPPALKQLISEGAKLRRLPKDVMDAAFKASREVYAELNDKNPNWKKIYDDYSRFMKEQYQWTAIAESSYDQYMAAQKL
ncbi:twin-arginine translocation signal domain-containing protein [Aromatoleum evansii]|uniref:Twin-arginine translocation signal domain-containing protein n=1 Tax=Aromatoleum evansii TaxID=59406 RepID=A0ABZ1ANF8_AROEV|nr:twin-arginine translocation signal domain-containing protein [Aromatoleum evansii]WRL47401.1 twin-arginine translocation signal domain-containing protein [Aromatoleum evansii]